MHVAARDGVDAGGTGHLRQRSGVPIDLVTAGGRVADAARDHLEGARLVGREPRPDVVLHLAAGDGGRQYAVVGKAELDPQERQPEHDEQRDDGQGDRHGTAHHERGDPVPDALADGFRVPAQQPQRVDPRAEHGEERREGNDRGDAGEQRHADAGVRERPQEREREPDRIGSKNSVRPSSAFAV